mgnify:FL=1
MQVIIYYYNQLKQTNMKKMMQNPVLQSFVIVTITLMLINLCIRIITLVFTGSFTCDYDNVGFALLSLFGSIAVLVYHFDKSTDKK